MAQFVKVCISAEASVADVRRIPIEPEGYILTSTLSANFYLASCLMFQVEGPEGPEWSSVRVVDDKLYPPVNHPWSETRLYVVVRPQG
jgi:hypothetical protein